MSWIVLNILPTALGRSDNLNDLYRCTTNDWCCSLGGNTTDCCYDTTDGSNLFSLPEGIVARVGNGTLSNSSISTTTGTQTSNAGATQTATSDDATATRKSTTLTSDMVSTQTATLTVTHSATANCESVAEHRCAIVGTGVGLGVSIPLIAALVGVILFWLRERRIVKELREQLAASFIQCHKPSQNTSSVVRKPLRTRPRESNEPLLRGSLQDINVSHGSLMMDINATNSSLILASRPGSSGH